MTFDEQALYRHALAAIDQLPHDLQEWALGELHNGNAVIYDGAESEFVTLCIGSTPTPLARIHRNRLTPTGN